MGCCIRILKIKKLLTFETVSVWEEFLILSLMNVVAVYARLLFAEEVNGVTG